MGVEKLQHSAGTLAIDLGSTTTVVAYQANDRADPIRLDLPPITNRPGEVPSLLWQTADQPLIGRQVLEAGLNDSPDPRLKRDFKRQIGSHQGGADAEQAGRDLLQAIWRRLPDQLTVDRLVLSAPVDSYRRYRQWLVDACATLPVNDIALVDEPTAAAMGAGCPAGSRLLVVDLGGSTLDLALVALEGGEGRAAPIAQLLRLGGRNLAERSRQTPRLAKVLGKAGLRLGGRDIDRWIAAACCPERTAQAQPSAALLNAAERLKCRLSDPQLPRDQQVLELCIDPSDRCELALQLSPAELDALLEHQGFGEAMAQVLETTLTGGRRHGVGLEDLHGVVAVGGGAQLPWLRRWLCSHTSPAPLLTPPPVDAVALGGLRLTPDVQVRDVLQNGVSMQVWDRRSREHRWQPLYVAGQPWPSRDPLELVLAASRDGQTSVELVLGEPTGGDRHEVVYVDGVPTLRNRSHGPTQHQSWPAAAVHVALEPPGQAGEDCLRLHFAIDDQAQLTCAVEDLRLQRELGRHRLGTVR
ncbi:MAG: Hsp70 family protein [Synechococcus sp.]